MAEPDLIGFVGLGNMGAPMVRNMLRGGERVLLYDLRPEALQAFEGEEGCVAAQDLADLASRAAVVITMLPDSPAVRSAVLGDEATPGLVQGLAPDSLIVDMSSSFPGDTRTLGQTIAARSVGLVDAPVSGGVRGAVAGTLTIMAGGEDQLIDRVETVLSTMGTVVRTGALGSGHATKALNNVLSAMALSATSEVLHVGMKFGLDPHIMTAIFNTSTGRNTTTENKVEQYLLNGSFEGGFALALLSKDVRMAKTLADDLGLDMSLLNACSALLDRASEALGPEADHTEVFRYIEQEDDDASAG